MVRGEDRISQVPAEPSCVAMLLLLRLRKNRQELAFTLLPTRPRERERPGLLQLDFRSSIAWLDDSLSTLRGVRLPAPDARLASGCWLGSAGRVSHPLGSTERFQLCFSFT